MMLSMLNLSFSMAATGLGSGREPERRATPTPALRGTTMEADDGRAASEASGSGCDRGRTAANCRKQTIDDARPSAALSPLLSL